MNIIREASPTDLDDSLQRTEAKLARIARSDARYGGSRALVLAKRMDRINAAADFESVVTAAYTDPQGTASEYLAYECPECGEVVQGLDAARAHCADCYEIDQAPVMSW